jgi:hypothetical protein
MRMDKLVFLMVWYNLMLSGMFLSNYVLFMYMMGQKDLLKEN